MTRARQPGAQPPRRDAAAAEQSADLPVNPASLPQRRPGAQLPAASNRTRASRSRPPTGRPLFTSQGPVKGETPADISDDSVLLRIRTALEGLP